jgi:hypothetical protein
MGSYEGDLSFRGDVGDYKLRSGYGNSVACSSLPVGDYNLSSGYGNSVAYSSLPRVTGKEKQVSLFLPAPDDRRSKNLSTEV